jgi:hypothetical protein
LAAQFSRRPFSDCARFCAYQQLRCCKNAVDSIRLVDARSALLLRGSHGDLSHCEDVVIGCFFEPS